MLNDMIQSLVLAIYPDPEGGLQSHFRPDRLDHPGLISSLRHRCSRWSECILTAAPNRIRCRSPWDFTLAGLLLLAIAPNFYIVLLAAALVGTGSPIFHPESSRVARMASGGRHGFAQSLFQVGGNFGSSLGPLLAAAVIAPYGQKSIAWFSLAALLAIVVLLQISKWYAHHQHGVRGKASSACGGR